jgi:hypothetical protein
VIFQESGIFTPLYYYPVTVISNIDEESGEPYRIYFPTDIYGAFRYVINKEKNIQSTRAV